MAKNKRQIFQVKVTLQGSKPPIWRRLELPADLTLHEVHHVLQAAMGWYDCHLHQFLCSGVANGPADPELDLDLHQRDERTTLLSGVLRRPKDRILYEYDFGDGWEHDVVLEKILAPEEGRRYPTCTAGRRACPPEDCGGMGGYYRLLGILADPDHPEHEEMKDWLGGERDPSAFDVREVAEGLPRISTTQSR